MSPLILNQQESWLQDWVNVLDIVRNYLSGKVLALGDDLLKLVQSTAGAETNQFSSVSRLREVCSHAHMYTLAPLVERARAMPLPIPVPPPVMRTT